MPRPIKQVTRSQVESVNPVVPNGVTVYEKDTGLSKVGDGATRYNALPYSEGGSVTIPDTQATDAEVAAAIAAQTIGKEIGYAERWTTDTTTNAPDDDATLMANRISGISVVVTGIGRPVEVEAFALVAHSVALGVVYNTIMMNGVRILQSGRVLPKASAADTLVSKRRIVLDAGVEYTFELAKTIDTAGTGTWFASEASEIPIYLSVVQR